MNVPAPLAWETFPALIQGSEVSTSPDPTWGGGRGELPLTWPCLRTLAHTADTAEGLLIWPSKSFLPHTEGPAKVPTPTILLISTCHLFL